MALERRSNNEFQSSGEKEWKKKNKQNKIEKS